MRRSLFLRSAALLLCLFGTGIGVYGQQCTGNLGENIFTDGDFGSGSANVLTPDPDIAPGFNYTTSPPPNDGSYTVTNNTAVWTNIFPAWRRFGDNSNDPNGYMMLVNASYEPGLFYEQEVSGLCGNTLYQFSADVTNVVQRGSNQLLPNVSFLLNNEEYINTGFIPENGEWRTYGFTFTTGPGQNSVTLALRNNAPGGIGNDLALDNISFRACGPEALILPTIASNICEDGDPITLTATIDGDQFDTPALQWQRSPDGGATWTDLPGENAPDYVHNQVTSGRYFYRYLLANSPDNLANSKCRIVSNTKEVYVVPKYYEITDSICSGLTFAVGDNLYDRTGDYVDTLVSSIGCDSIVALRLTVVPDPGLTADLSLEDPSCSYRSDGSVLLTGVTGGTQPFTFRFDGAAGAVGSRIDSLAEGAYPYRITDRYGCSTEDSVRLTSPYPFSVDLGPDLDLTLGETAVLAVNASQPNADYTWLPEGIVDCDSVCTQVSVLPTSSVTLQLLATSAVGCQATDSLRLTVRKDRLVYIPSAFSPNGDGRNDYFTVFGSVPNVVDIANLRIFDRWGGEIYSAGELPANTEPAGWDGTVAGTEAPVGTYLYLAEVRFLDGVTETYSGTLSLIR